MEDNKSMIFVLVIWFLMVGLIICSKSHAECVANNDVLTIIDISSDRTLSLICETSSKVEANIELAKQKSVNCFVTKEAGEEIYRVFCPVKVVYTGNV